MHFEFELTDYCLCLNRGGVQDRMILEEGLIAECSDAVASLLVSQVARHNDFVRVEVRHVQATNSEATRIILLSIAGLSGEV